MDLFADVIWIKATLEMKIDILVTLLLFQDVSPKMANETPSEEEEVSSPLMSETAPSPRRPIPEKNTRRNPGRFTR